MFTKADIERYFNAEKKTPRKKTPGHVLVINVGYHFTPTVATTFPRCCFSVAKVFGLSCNR